MNFIQKLYYSDKPIVLTNNLQACITDNSEMSDYKVFHGLSGVHFSEALDHLHQKNNRGAIIEEQSSGALMQHIDNFFKVIKAGGGLVYNANDEVLMIFRRGKWDLPKGKLDKGETIEECALREVIEETGIKQLTLGEHLTETWHLYTDRGRNLVKHSVWYTMTSTDNEPLKPQAEEDIMEARWVAPDQLAPLMDNSYKAIKDVLTAAKLDW